MGCHAGLLLPDGGALRPQSELLCHSWEAFRFSGSRSSRRQKPQPESQNAIAGPVFFALLTLLNIATTPIHSFAHETRFACARKVKNPLLQSFINDFPSSPARLQRPGAMLPFPHALTAAEIIFLALSLKSFLSQKIIKAVKIS